MELLPSNLLRLYAINITGPGDTYIKFNIRMVLYKNLHMIISSAKWRRCWFPVNLHMKSNYHPLPLSRSTAGLIYVHDPRYVIAMLVDVSEGARSSKDKVLTTNFYMLSTALPGLSVVSGNFFGQRMSSRDLGNYRGTSSVKIQYRAAESTFGASRLLL